MEWRGLASPKRFVRQCSTLNWLFTGTGFWVSLLPKFFYELATVYITRQLEKVLSLLISDDPRHVLLEPTTIDRAERFCTL